MSNPHKIHYCKPTDVPAYMWQEIMHARRCAERRSTIPHPAPGPMYGAIDYGPGRCDCHKQHPKPPCPYDDLPKVPSVKKTESVKVVELKDAFNNLRYKIVMSSIDVTTDPKFGKVYEIEVVNCFSAPDPLVIVHRPCPEEAPINTAAAAQEIFDSYVLAYENLIKAETKDFQDISTYKEGIGYEITKPECCATCAYARLAKTENDYIYGVSGRIECTNPANMLDYDFNTEQSTSPLAKASMFPKCKPETATKLVVYPNVHAFGKCNKYVACDRDPYKPVNGDSVADIIERRTETMRSSLCAFADNISAAIEDATDISTVSSNIISAVGEAIENQLSSGNIIVDGNSELFDYNDDGVIDEKDIIVGGQGA